jgi:hypothetical protein
MRDLDRVKMIQAIRDLAQFIEDHPELPCPNSVRAQHSLTKASPRNADIVRDVATMLGKEPDYIEDEHGAAIHWPISAYPETVEYWVHGMTVEAVES